MEKGIIMRSMIIIECKGEDLIVSIAFEGHSFDYQNSLISDRQLLFIKNRSYLDEILEDFRKSSHDITLCDYSLRKGE